MPTPDAPTPDARAQLRWSVYWLLICASAGLMLGRILAVDAVDRTGVENYRIKKIPAELAQKRQALEARGISGKALQDQLDSAEKRLRRQAQLRRPFLSANDRSRWCTVRALVEEDMRVPDAPYAIDRVIREPNWDTIDMVKHDGHLYSSKPTLLPTLMAAVYWPIHRWTGATLAENPYEIDRFMLVVFNLVPMVIFFLLLAGMLERWGTTDWGRIFTMTAAAFGVMLTTFSVTINNHLPAAVCTATAVWAASRIWLDDRRELRYFVLAGCFSSLAAAFDFPAASLLAVMAVVMFWRSPRRALLGFAPAALVVAVAFFGTEWTAHHSLRPAYLHRGGGGVDDWYDYTYLRDGRTVESYWKRTPTGVDRGEPSRGVYALNVLVGHHGVFSLTPVWLLSLAGLFAWLWPGDSRRRWATAAFFAISAACIAFYLAQPEVNRNYGGTTSGPRWLFWLAPLWLLAMAPMADALASRRWTRGLALVLLLLSAVSAAYPTWNPWTHPWLWDAATYLGRGT